MKTFWAVVATTLVGILIIGFMFSMLALFVHLVEQMTKF